VFTFEWIGDTPESGVPKILDRSMIDLKNSEDAIAHAKSLLKRETDFPGGRLYSVRVFNAESTLIWRGNVADA
jgi:tRNA A58 N-methylase Trm61